MSYNTFAINISWKKHSSGPFSFADFIFFWMLLAHLELLIQSKKVIIHGIETICSWTVYVVRMITHQIGLVENGLVGTEERELPSSICTGTYVEHLAVDFGISVITVGPILTAERCWWYSFVERKLSLEKCKERRIREKEASNIKLQLFPI